VDKDWEPVGWRGVVLNRGILWLEYDGKIRSVPYESEIEKQKRNVLIEAERKTLYSDLRSYSEPVLKWTTKSYRIRIDRLGESGSAKYRYAAWPVNKLPSDKPDLVVDDGVNKPDGSGGNHYYDFKKGIYLYRCYVKVLRSWDDAPGRFEIYENGNCILREPVITASGAD
jgi:hypothetical protein